MALVAYQLFEIRNYKGRTLQMRRMLQQNPNRDLRRQRDGRSVRRQWLWLACGLALVGGFVVAARQQVAAVQYGYQSEALRRERAHLVEEQQRLLLALEESSSPARLERAAREIGLEPTRPAQIEAVKRSAIDDLHAAPVPARVASISSSAGALHRRRR
jgi:hypothetical protein